MFRTSFPSLLMIIYIYYPSLPFEDTFKKLGQTSTRTRSRFVFFFLPLLTTQTYYALLLLLLLLLLLFKINKTNNGK